MTTTSSSTFGALLRELRLAAGLTQETLAARARLSVRAISDLERGARRTPYPHTVQQMARALHLTATDRARLEATLTRRPATPSPEPATTIARSLPLAVTSFVGREHELSAVQQRFATARLLTLTGAGGSGKTRLALEAARALEPHYPDGAWLVELAALADPVLVPSAVASVLGVREQPGQSLFDTLVVANAGRRRLLVLDNCEHLLDGCARLVAALLRGCPRLSLLATSREPLGIAGEVVWPVPPLAVPDLQSLPSLDELAGCESVALFVERATAARPDFQLTAENAPAVARLCARLDGLPLALEMAAARVRTFPPAALVTRLDDRFHLLTSGSRTALPRHQTLRAAIDWSYELLTEAEQTLLRRLSVFAGGGTLPAAEAVCAGGTLAPVDVVTALPRLVDHSLVLVNGSGGEPRYRLPETVQQYCTERLIGTGEIMAVCRQHRDYYLALVERAEPELYGSDQGIWLDSLAVEFDNLRTALAWCAEHDPLTGLGFASSLRNFWRIRGYFAEGQSWLQRLLARAPDQTEQRVKALLAAADLALHLGDRASARAGNEAALALSRRLGIPALISQSLKQLADVLFWSSDFGLAGECLDEALPLLRAVRDERNLAEALRRLGQLLVATGDYERAEACLKEGLALHEAAGNTEASSSVLRDLIRATIDQGKVDQAEARVNKALAIASQYGNVAELGLVRQAAGRIAWWQGDLVRAARLFEASLAESRAFGQRMPVVLALIGLGLVALQRGELADARAHLAEGLALCREGGNVRVSSAALHGLGLEAWRRGDAEYAVTALGESLAIRWKLGERPGIAECLEGLATVAAGLGQAGRAARLLGTAEALRDSIGAPLPMVARPDYEAEIGTMRAALGEANFVAIWAAGQCLTIDQAVAEALADAATATATIHQPAT